MDFEEDVHHPRPHIAYGAAAWSTDDDEDDDIVVDEFLWPVVNAVVNNVNAKGTKCWQDMNAALTTGSGSFVYRLGNLGMTYDPDILSSALEIDEDVIETDSMGEMVHLLRRIYVAHEEDQAVAMLDTFMTRVSPCFVLKMPLDSIV
jgi:hypothetical protein